VLPVIKMSKAFTKEPDDTDDDAPEAASALPAGRKNYITPGGLQRLHDELQLLVTKTRPEMTAIVSWAASNGDRSENGDYIYGKRRLREIDRRIRFLTKRIESAVVVDPVANPKDQVFFGATVTICDADGVEKIYTIVGVDEIDLAKNRISWVSPLATVLMKSRVGDVVNFRTPNGERELEIVMVEYLKVE